MGKYIEVTIRADIPGDNEELGHDAIVQTRDPANVIVDLLTTLGLQNATATRRIGSIRTPKPGTLGAPPVDPAPAGAAPDVAKAAE
jgi:hypothetical protein